MAKIIVVQGGQWGSEAKGAIAAYLCIARDIDYAVRTGAINAGHTVVYDGKPYAMQQIPTGWVNPDTRLVIGAGAYIHPETLCREVKMINGAMPHLNVMDRLYIDRRCGLHTDEASQLSKEANRHHSIGATGKGCSEAIVAKIRNRNDGYELFADSEHSLGFEQSIGDTVNLLNEASDTGARILIEGTQGTHLDLHLGPYPFTTSRMTSAANWVAESGLSPSLPYEVVLVCRTYPIRVAGNSGPMKNEIEWLDLARRINDRLIAADRAPLVSPDALAAFEISLFMAATKAIEMGKYKMPMDNKGFPDTKLSKWTASQRDEFRVAASELHRDALELCDGATVKELRKLFEMTTVTKKLRRIAEMNMDDLRYAVMINRPAWIALTFVDYIEPLVARATTDQIVSSSDLSHVRALIAGIERELSTPIKLVSTGPNHNNVHDLR